MSEIPRVYMKSVTFYIPEKLEKKISRRSEKLGLSKSEILRQAVIKGL